MIVQKKLLEKQGYRFVGSHSAIKICYWTKKSLIDEDVCYKQQFYGIPSHQCCQMTPCLVCPNQCIFCWRSTEFFTGTKLNAIDEPKEIIKNCEIEQKKLLEGYHGNKFANGKKLKEAETLKAFAISLSGEPTLYLKLGTLIEELHKQRRTSFLVTNGMFPKNVESLSKMPTQLYVSLNAPTKQLYKKVCKPTLKDYWQRFTKTLELLPSLNTRTTLRITLIKGLNLGNEKDYAKLIKIANPKFLEIKSYMYVGSSRQRLDLKNMPLHFEIKNFANKISKLTTYKIIDEKENSRVVLLMEEDKKDRKLNVLNS